MPRQGDGTVSIDFVGNADVRSVPFSCRSGEIVSLAVQDHFHLHHKSSDAH